MDEIPICDHELLLRFAKEGDERAFEVLVARYANLVFGVALRRGVDRQGAEDVTQKVFAVLARKAKRLRRKASLAGWLSRTATLEAAFLRRSDSNRKRKMAKYEQSGSAPETDRSASAEEDALWRAALPHLDDVLGDLSPSDQEVVLQRFYNDQSFAAIASVLDKSEAAVQKQCRRALEKMSKLLKRRGVAVSSVTIAGILGTELANAAPAAAFTALSQGAIGAAPTIAGAAILTNTLETMAYAKTKTALVVAAVAAIPTGMQWNKISELESELRDRPALVSDEGQQVAALAEEIADLKGQLAAQASPSPAVVSALPSAGAAPEESGETGMGALAEMFEDPAMREVVRSQMKGSIGMMYGGFLTHTGYEGVALEQFEELLVDRQMEAATKGMRAMSKGVSEEERQRISDELNASREASSEKIKAMLGEELFDEFVRYEDSSSERMELNAYKTSLVSQGVAELSPEQEEGLMGIMYDERKAFKYTGGFDPTGQEIPQWSMNQERMDAIAADHRRLQQAIAARAGEVLEGDQIEAFQNNQDSFHKMMEGSLKMSMQMFGGDGGE